MLEVKNYGMRFDHSKIDVYVQVSDVMVLS